MELFFPAWDEVREILAPILEPIVTLARQTKSDVKAKQDLLRAHTRFVTTGTWTKPKKKRTKRKKTKSEPEKPKVETPFNMDGSDYSFLPPVEMDDPEDRKPPGVSSPIIVVRRFKCSPTSIIRYGNFPITRVIRCSKHSSK